MKAILLDVYGTLFQYERTRLLPVFEELTKAHGLSVNAQRLFNRWTLHDAAFRRRRVYQADGRWHAEPFTPYRAAWASCFKKAFDDLSISGDPEAAADALIANIAQRNLHDEVAEALNALRTYASLALLSNADSSFLLPSLSRHNLTFDAVIYSEIEGVYKPHPRLFLRALERLGAAPGEVLFAGDSPTEDVAGAVPLGIPTAWVNRRGEEWPLVNVRPTYEVKDLWGLVEILEGARRPV